MIDEPFRIEVASWESDERALAHRAERVFIDEQKVPEDEEWDDLDPRSIHALARDAEGRAIGTGRLTPERKIGRMAVLPEWRGKGVGEAILRTLLEQARGMGYPQIALHAQVHAIPFYERAGFAAEGEVFDEAGIPHRTMRMALDPRAQSPQLGRVLPPASESRTIDVQTLAQAQSVTDELILAAKHKLWIYTRDLDALLYDRQPTLDAIKRVALAGRGAEVLILCHDAGTAVREGHRLLKLLARLSTYIHLRRPVTDEDRQYPSAFLLNDTGGFFHRTLGSRFEGEAETHAPGRQRTLRSYFEQVWQRAEPDIELRQLSV
jgi:predicted GNAT family N-acyltransferase